VETSPLTVWWPPTRAPLSGVFPMSPLPKNTATGSSSAHSSSSIVGGPSATCQQPPSRSFITTNNGFVFIGLEDSSTSNLHGTLKQKRTPDCNGDEVDRPRIVSRVSCGGQMD